MGTPFLSEIRIMSFNFAPKGWAMCNGQTLPINQNQALFSLLGTTYGGNGQTTFALPNLRGRVPMHMGNGHTLGETAGSTAVTINIQTMASHNHPMNARNAAAVQGVPGKTPTNNTLAQGAAAPPPGTAVNIYGTGPIDPAQTFLPTMITNVGGSQPHTNMEPYLVLNFCIALQGAFPSQN
jgi:microcystin-dependent protein